ncbi:MAG TPA: allene oxide cyclase family protein [Actinomycetota bacterium]|nr:allene oxide cyclase family protein [Actinomycetota bacterium]
MRRRLVLAAATAAAGSLAWAVGARAQAPMTITVIERPTTDKVIDVGREGDSPGDLLTFHNRVYDETGATPVGRDAGRCVRIFPHRGTWECTWTTFLPEGQITVEGPFSDTADTTLAITGGTGAYTAARGEMDIEALPDGGYRFVFHLVP